MNDLSSPRTPDDIDLGALWRAIASRKGLLAGLVLGSALITLIALQFVTPLYTSEARVLIEHDDPSFLRPRNDENRNDARVHLDPEAVASQVQVLLSRDLAYEVVKELKLHENPEFNTSSGVGHRVKMILVSIGLVHPPSKSAKEELALDNFARHLSVFQVAKSRVIAINFESRDPKLAAAAANALADKYLGWAQKAKLAQTKGASNWLNEQITTLRARVAESEEAVEKFRSSSGLIDGANNVSLENQQLSELNSQLIMARAQRSEAEARADLIRKMLNEKGDVASAPDVLKSALIQRLLEQRVQVQRQLAEMSATLLPSHPRLQELNSELKDLQSQIRREAQKVVSSLENEAQIAGARETSLRGSLNELKKNSSGMREDEIKLRSLEREAKANRDLLESYLARYSEASARDEMSVPAHATIIARAHVESEPSFPQIVPMTALVAFAVGLLSVATIIARALMTGGHAGYYEHAAPAHRREAPPRRPEADREHIHASPAAAPVPPPAARVRTVKARSLRAAAKVPVSRCGGPLAHVSMVAASNLQANTAQEALELARSIAASGVRVGIVDFSTAGQGVSGILGLSNIPGLGELLAGSAGFEDVVSADPEGSVQIIPPGALQRDVFTGEASDKWVRILSALRQTYDCLVLHVSLSGARRLIAGLGPDEIATIVLVTDGREDAALIAQIGDHLLSEGGAAIELVTCKGNGQQPQPAGKPRVAGFGQRAAAAI